MYACLGVNCLKSNLGTGIQFGVGHRTYSKIVPDVGQFAVQFGQFVLDDFRKHTLYGNALRCNSIFVLKKDR